MATLSVRAEADVLCAFLSTRHQTLAKAARSWRAIGVELNRQGLRKLLLEQDCDGSLDAADSVKLAASFEELGFAQIRLALVPLALPSTAKLRELEEALDRVDVKYFDEADAAMIWLAGLDQA